MNAAPTNEPLCSSESIQNSSESLRMSSNFHLWLDVPDHRVISLNANHRVIKWPLPPNYGDASVSVSVPESRIGEDFCWLRSRSCESRNDSVSRCGI